MVSRSVVLVTGGSMWFRTRAIQRLQVSGERKMTVSVVLLVSILMLVATVVVNSISGGWLVSGRPWWFGGAVVAFVMV